MKKNIESAKAELEIVKKTIDLGESVEEVFEPGMMFAD